jgi:hypothetical protein
VPVTLPPPLDCTILLPVGFAGGIPLPGSKEWCDGFEDTRQLFITIGRAVVQWAVGDGSNDILAQVNTPAIESGQSSTSGVGAVGGALLGLTPGVPGDVVRRTIQCWAQALNATGLCEVDGIIALAALKALLGLLGQVRVGWDLIVWFTVDLHLPVHMFDEVIDQFLASMCPAEIPSVPEAVECLLLGTAPNPRSAAGCSCGARPSTCGCPWCGPGARGSRRRRASNGTGGTTCRKRTRWRACAAWGCMTSPTGGRGSTCTTSCPRYRITCTGCRGTYLTPITSAITTLMEGSRTASGRNSGTT